MREERVSFYSEGEQVAAILRLPDDDGGAPAAGYPAIVQGPGWLQLKEAKRNPPYHRAFTEAGFAVLIIDFRGFGESEGDRTDLLPQRWIDDLVNAVTYLTTRADIDASRIGTFGSGSTGGGNAIVLPAVDRRVRASVSQMPIADGADWLRRMRREYEWYEFVARVEEDARNRALTGKGEMVHPRRDLMVTTPVRAEREAKENVGAGHVVDVSLRSAAAIMAYRPIDYAPSARAVLIIAVADDPVTPTDHAHQLYDAAQQPKKLIVQRDTTHYVAYEQYADVVIPEMVAWFREHLTPEGPIDVWETTATGQVQSSIGNDQTDEGAGR
jgi:dipeptidyl aminopeptidase/acylaminoacyl peptidase